VPEAVSEANISTSFTLAKLAPIRDRELCEISSQYASPKSSVRHCASPIFSAAAAPISARKYRIGVPLRPGAENFYKEAGLLK